MSLGGRLTVYHSEGSLDAIFIKDALDNFSKKKHDKPYVIT